MANVQKFNRSNMGHMLRHYARQPGENVKRNNERIDPDQTHLNYNLAAELQPLPQKDFINKRLSEIKHLDYHQCLSVVRGCSDNPTIDQGNSVMKYPFVNSIT